MRAKAWSVFATDSEYIGGLLKNMPCWLVRTDLQQLLPAAKSKTGDEDAYALVCLQSDLVVEVFNLPTQPWWNRVSPLGTAGGSAVHGLVRPSRIRRANWA